MTELVIFRAFQGIGGGIMMTNAFTVIADIFPPNERGKYQGRFPLAGASLPSSAHFGRLFNG